MKCLLFYAYPPEPDGQSLQGHSLYLGIKNLGIEEIKTVGEKFNPEYHEAVSHEEKKDFAPETVFEEVQAGYFLYGKVIKPAKVKVTK